MQDQTPNWKSKNIIILIDARPKHKTENQRTSYRRSVMANNISHGKWHTEYYRMRCPEIWSIYLIQKLIKPSSTSNNTTLKDISHLYNLCKTCSLKEEYKQNRSVLTKPGRTWGEKQGGAERERETETNKKKT